MSLALAVALVCCYVFVSYELIWKLCLGLLCAYLLLWKHVLASCCITIDASVTLLWFQDSATIDIISQCFSTVVLNLC
jgi:hypothetical protein